MLKDNRPDAREQDVLFEYSEEAWNGIRQIVAFLGCNNIDALTFERSFGGRLCRDLGLRDVLQLTASQYRLNAGPLSTLTAPKIRTGLEQSFDQISEAHDSCEAIVRSGVLWKLNLNGIYDASLHVRLEEIGLPLLSEIVAHFTKQLEALVPHPYHPEKNQNAAKRAQNEYYAAILGVWDELAAGAGVKAQLRMRFFQAVAEPVLGVDVATPKAISKWFERY